MSMSHQRGAAAPAAVTTPLRRLLVAGLFAGCAFVPSIAAAATPVWKGTTSPDWQDGTNWSTNTVPTAADDVQITQPLDNEPTVSTGTASAANLTIGSPADSPPHTLTIQTGASLNVGALVTISPGTGDSGQIQLTSGGKLTAQDLDIAHASGTLGSVTVTGASSSLTTSGGVIVGYGGNGSFSLSQGGQAQVSGALIIADLHGSSGTLAVDGGSLKATHGLIIGAAGSGAMTVSNGGYAQSTGLTSIGIGGTGSLLVTGANSKFDINSVNVGDGGTGTMDVVNGASAATYSTVIGGGAHANGTLTVDAGTYTGTLVYVGESGSGSLTVRNGGTLTESGNIIVGDNSGSSGTLLDDGAGSKVSTSGLTVGNGGAGSMTVSNGAYAQSTGIVSIGNGGAGSVLVTDPNSKVDLNFVNIGDGGTGTMTVTNGSSAATYWTTLGEGAAGNGTLTLDAATYTGNTAILGDNGAGFVQIQNGGRLKQAEIDIAANPGAFGELDVHGPGSTVDTIEIYVGLGNTGLLNVDSGAVVTAQETSVGSLASGAGTVGVSGPSSSFVTTHDLALGDAGNGGASALAGGAISAGALRMGASPSGVGSLLIDGAGSTGTFGFAIVGVSGSGDIRVANGGTLTVTNSTSTGLLLAQNAGSQGSLTIGSTNPFASAAPGIVQAPTITFGAGSGALYISHTAASYDLASALSGTGTIWDLAGTTTLSGDSSGFSGQTSIIGNIFTPSTLLVTGTLGGDLYAGAGQGGSGGIFGGTGTVLGTVTVGPSGTLVGQAGQTLTMGALDLGAGAQTNVTLGAPGNAGLFNVTGNLTLDGTLNVNGAPGFGLGLYRLFDYGGTLTDNGLDIGTVPAGQPSDYSVQTSTPGQVNLLYGTVVASRNFWDGDAPGSANNGLVDGGSGTWSTTSSNFTDINGSANGPMSPQPTFVIFAGAPGTVTVDNSAGQVSVTGMQFYVDGYSLSGGAIALSGNQAQIRVGDSTPEGAAYTATVASPLTGSSQLQKMDLGTLILTGDNSYTGGTSVAQGTLQIGNGGTTGSVLGDIDVAQSAMLTFSRGDAVTFAGTISGAGTLDKESAGTLTLTAASTLTGPVRINGGTLALSGNGDLSSASSVAVGGTFDISGLGHGSTVNTMLGSGTVALGGNTLTIANGQDVFAGVIQGSGGLTIGGGGLILAGANTYTGLTRIAPGTALIVGSGTQGSIVSDVADDGVLAFARSDNLSYGGNISGSGRLIQQGAGTLTLTGANSYSGGTSILAGTLAGNTVSIQGNVLDNGALVFNQASDGLFFGSVTGSGSLTKTGAGDLGLLGPNSYSGGTFVQAGSLSGTAASIQGAVVNNAVVNFTAQGSDTYAGKMSGTGSLKLFGNGSLTLTGANSYSGGTLISGGATLIGAAGPIQGSVVDDGTLVFLQPTNASFGGAVSGAGSVAKQGGGTLTLTGANSYTGGTTVAAGTLVGDTASLQGNILDNAALVFNQAAAGTYGGSLSGSGSLTKQGPARLNLTGDSSGFTGTTTVAAGLLSVNGSLAKSTVTVGSGGTLGGTGTIGGLIVQSGGAVAPGNSIGTINVAGNVVFQPGATFTVEVDPATGASDRIAASGSATLAGKVDLLSPAALRYGSSFRILTATQGINGTFSGVTVNGAAPASGPFLLTGLSYTANAVDFLVDVNRPALAAAGTTANQSAVAGAAAQLPGDNLILAALANGSAGAAQASFDTLSGEIHAAIPRQAFEDARMVRDAALTRSRSGEGRGVWAQAFGSWGATSGDGNYARSERTTTGLAGGADAALGASGRIGIAAAYTKGRTDVTARGSRADLETIHLGVYGSAEAGALRLRAGAFWGGGHAETHRTAAFGTVSESERARYGVTVWQGYGEAGYAIGFDGGSVQPFANLTVLGINRHGFTETGGVAALGGAQRSDALELGTIGVQLEAGAKGPVSVKASVGWRHAWGDRGGTATLGLAGAPAFTIFGPEIAKEAAVVDAGLSWRLGKGATLGASYAGTFGKGRDHSAKVSLSLPF